jgi:tetratricopeptide (TPR) repeat protein
MKKKKKFLRHQKDSFSELNKIKQFSNQEQTVEFGNLVEKATNLYLNNQVDDALDLIQNLLNINPDTAIIYSIKGVCLSSKGLYDQAIKQYELALKITPNDGEIYYNLANTLVKKDQSENLTLAVKYYLKSLKIQPNNIDVINNLGITYSYLEQLELASDCFNQSIQLISQNPIAYYNLGLVYRKSFRLDLEIECYQKAIALDPNYIDANWNLALVRLLNGEFHEGWKYYHWRYKKHADLDLRQYSKPLWDGRSLKNKTLFIYHEQGIGDTLQCIRYIKVLSKQGAKIILDSPPVLLKLIAKIPEISFLTVNDNELPYFDFYIPVMSIPAILESDLKTIPNTVPYLFTDKKTHHQDLKQNNLLKIGIVWAGNPKHQNDKNRSIDLSFFEPLIKIQGTQFFSLQVGERSQDLSLNSQFQQVVDLSSELKDYEDTASIIHQLDLIITVDTSIAHLAGAMGIPVWVLLPFIPDWRWLLDRSDSPWYPTMRLFRQEKIGEWQFVVDEVAFVLKHELKKSVQELRLLKLFWLVIHAFKQQNINIGIYYLSELLMMINTFSQNLSESDINQIKSILKQILRDIKAQNYSNLTIICEEKLLPLMNLNLSDYLS